MIFSLRAKQAHTPSQDTSRGLTQYWQVSFSIGYLTIFGDICVVMQALFVKTTRGSPSQHQPSLLVDETSDIAMGRSSSSGNSLLLQSPVEDQPAKRRLYRRAFGILKLLNLVPIILGSVGGALYFTGETHKDTGDTVQLLRSVFLVSEPQSSCHANAQSCSPLRPNSYSTTIIAFALILAIQIAALWGYFNISHIRKSSALAAFAMASILVCPVILPPCPVDGHG